MAAASAIAIFYYLRVLVVLYMQAPENADGEAGSTAASAALGEAPSLNRASTLALTALVVVVLAIGLYPEPWLRAVGTALASMMSG